MENQEVWVAGEALIDLVTRAEHVTPIVGGGPANTAKALSRLGVKTSFIGGISSDEFGKQITAELLASGVGVNLVKESDLPTALAIAKIDNSGVASYEFQLEKTATFDFARSWLPEGQTAVLHIGSVATIFEPGASELFEWAKRLSAALIFDPNVRPAVEGDKASYQQAVERWVGISTIVKLSVEDLDWLYSEELSEVVNRWLDSGVSLVVVTLGEAGLKAYGKGIQVEVPGVQIQLVDTVGAGDTIGAVLVEGFLNFGLQGLLDERVLRGVLERAVVAAGITCSRAGANPPWKSELN